MTIREEIERAERMLKREQESAPYRGKRKVIEALEARIRILEGRERREIEAGKMKTSAQE